MGQSRYDPALMAKLPKDYLDENIGHHLTVVCVVFLTVQTIFVILFYLSRHSTRTLKGIDCWLFMPLSFLATTGLCIVAILMVQMGGAGRHTEAVLLHDPTGATDIRRTKLSKAVEFLDYIAISGSKFVILYLYLRIFNTRRRYQIATYIIAVIILLHAVASIVTALTICRPFSAYWTRTGSCGDVFALWRYISVPNIATDVMILVLPLPALYKLQVNIYSKIGVVITFLVGSGGMITSILRLIAFMKPQGYFKDQPWDCAVTMAFTVTEASTYLIASCMPALRPLKRHYFGDHSFTKQIGSLFPKTSQTAGASTSWRKETLPETSSEKGMVQLNELEKSASPVHCERKIVVSHGDGDGFFKLNERSDFV